jgi:hypothetical protein
MANPIFREYVPAIRPSSPVLTGSCRVASPGAVYCCGRLLAHCGNHARIDGAGLIEAEWTDGALNMSRVTTHCPGNILPAGEVSEFVSGSAPLQVVSTSSPTLQPGVSTPSQSGGGIVTVHQDKWAHDYNKYEIDDWDLLPDA